MRATCRSPVEAATRPAAICPEPQRLPRWPQKEMNVTRTTSDMPGYWVARAKVIDPVAYKRYTDRIPEIMKKYCGEVLSRGARYETLEGPDHFDRFLLIRFASFEAAKRCFESPVEAASFRRSGAEGSRKYRSRRRRRH